MGAKYVAGKRLTRSLTWLSCCRRSAVLLFFAAAITVDCVPPTISWARVPGALKSVSVGQAGVWGANSLNNIYYRTGTYKNANAPGTGWQQIPGEHMHGKKQPSAIVGVNIYPV